MAGVQASGTQPAGPHPQLAGQSHPALPLPRHSRRPAGALQWQHLTNSCVLLTFAFSPIMHSQAGASARSATAAAALGPNHVADVLAHQLWQ